MMNIMVGYIYCNMPIKDKFIILAPEINIINGNPLIIPVPTRSKLFLKSDKKEKVAV